MATAVANDEPLVDAEEVDEGDLMAYTMFVEVTNVNGIDGELSLTDVHSGKKLTMTGQALIESGLSANQYTESETLSRTDVVRVLEYLPKTTPMSVHFKKKDGTWRTLKGRVLGTREVNLGYIDVEDLELPADEHRLRQVNSRTIEYVIANGVKYNVR